MARAYTISKLAWIRAQRERLASKPRETPRRFVGRETHYLWGRRYLLTVEQREGKPCVTLDHRKMPLVVRPGSSEAVRAAAVHNWHKALLRNAVPLLIAKWESRLGVRVGAYFLQRMKTRWGSCNSGRGRVRSFV